MDRRSSRVIMTVALAGIILLVAFVTLTGR